MAPKVLLPTFGQKVRTSTWKMELCKSLSRGRGLKLWPLRFRRVTDPKEGRVGQSLETSGSKLLSPMMLAATWASIGQRRQVPHVVSPKVQAGDCSKGGQGRPVPCDVGIKATFSHDGCCNMGQSRPEEASPSCRLAQSHFLT